MLKRDYFLAAMAAGEYKRRAFVVSVFTLLMEGLDDWKKNPYNYRLVRSPGGYSYVDPNTGNLEQIEDGVVNVPLFGVTESVTLKPNDYPGLSEQIETTYGRLLFNYTVLYYAFGTKVPYINKKTSPRDLEDLIVDRVADIPEKKSDRSEDKIYIDEYLKFCDAMFYLTAFTQVCVPGATRKSMVTPVGLKEYKKQLLEENKDKLNDPAVIAKIDAALVKYDRDYIKGDPAENFMLADKYYNIVRKKLYGMHGAEAGLSETYEVNLIKNSLSEGWDINNFPAMNNALRAGSYDRGASTMLGGESVKWLFRALSNMRVTENDCNSKLGIIFDIDETNTNIIIGHYLIENGDTIHITNKEEAVRYIGKRVTVRSPMFCNLKMTDYCEKCVGDKLAAQKTGLSVAGSEFGSIMLNMFMKKMHGTQLAVAKMDYKKAIF